jgi:uncharacterized membrane protein
MQGIFILAVIFVLWLLAGPVIALVMAQRAARDASAARQQLRELNGRLAELEGALRVGRPAAAPEPPAAADPVMVPAEEQSPVAEPALKELLGRLAPSVPPPLPRPAIAEPAAWQSAPQVPPSPPPLVLDQEELRQDEPEQEEREAFSLEHFMGVKLFAWLGGVAMFFGVIFFVKYAFENNLIPPALRIAMGFVSGTGLLAGGLWVHRNPRYRVLAQAFCATGVLILYGVSFAAHAVYHFAAFGPVATFVLMGLITLVAFLVAVRLDALVVAVLGMLGGFMTPVLLATGQDNVLGLFGYIALLDLGLLAVSRHGRWQFLTSAAAVGTALMQIGWYGRFFTLGRYFEDPKTWVALGIFAVFIAVFLIGGWLNNRRREMDPFSAGAVLGLAAVAMACAFKLLDFHQLAERYGQLYGFVLFVQLAVIAAVLCRPQWGVAQIVAAGAVFLHLAVWSGERLTMANLGGALGLYLIFGALHAVAPMVLARRFPDRVAAVPLKTGPWVGPLVLLLMLLPLFHLSPVPMVIWAAVLAVDLLVIALAVVSAAMIPVVAALVLTLALAALWLLKVPVEAVSLMPFLGVVTGFAAVFSLASKWLVGARLIDKEVSANELSAAGALPVLSGVLPFVMLVLALIQLPVANPSPVFGVALLLTVLLAGLAIIGRHGPLVLVALLATLVVEAVWHTLHFKPDAPQVALAWYLGFYGLFLALPFVFRKACGGQASPWIASALAGVGHFLLVHNLVKHAYPNGMMGLLPAAFALPALVALLSVIRAGPETDSIKQSRIAWFGGVALLFITLIFPIQFDRQWLTVSWALEGALLLWLFRRVEHPGLQLTGLALLAVAFVRLALNPAVFADYPRGGDAVWNWHLYAFGLVAAAQFLGGYWFSDPAGRLVRFPARGALFALGGVLLFLLLNLEIADYFTPPGASCIAFQFGGNFPRDMTYSIGWGLFSLGLLGIGILKRSRHARFAAIGLLVVTLLKVFLHDLSEIESIFRIGALVGVAVIAFITSFLYQRFFDRSKTS